MSLILQFFEGSHDKNNCILSMKPNISRCDCDRWAGWLEHLPCDTGQTGDLGEEIEMKFPKWKYWQKKTYVWFDTMELARFVSISDLGDLGETDVSRNADLEDLFDEKDFIDL